MIDRGLANAIAGTAPAGVSGTFYRHAFIGMRELKASSAGGRWGPLRDYGVLYLGRPETSVIAEAYRSLVDAVEGMRPELVGPRRFSPPRPGATSATNCYACTWAASPAPPAAATNAPN